MDTNFLALTNKIQNLEQENDNQPRYNFPVPRAAKCAAALGVCVCVFTHVPYLSDMCNGDVAGALVHQREVHPRRWRWRWSSPLWPALSGLPANELCSHDGEK